MEEKNILSTENFLADNTKETEIQEEEIIHCPACANLSNKKKNRAEQEKKDLINRLKRIEGQVRGVQKMLENDAYCLDIINQASAINSAISSFNRKLLENHMHSCVVQNIKNGNEDVVDELLVLLQKMMR